jgi:diguanylate cyclase (GGDEF)-like protein
MGLPIKALVLSGLVIASLLIAPFIPMLYAVFVISVFLLVFVCSYLFFIAPMKKMERRMAETEQTLTQHKEKYRQDLNHATKQLNVEIAQRQAMETELAGQHDSIAQLAQYDRLTSLPNRVFFNESLNRAIMHAKRHKKVLAVLLIKLDSFNQVMAALGQSAADRVIKEMGARLSNSVRSDDILARLEGAEFIILLHDIGKPKFASLVAKKILQACAQPIHIDAQDIFLQASIGICIYPNDGDALEAMLKNVNTALDSIARTGGGTYQFYSKEMDTEAHEYLQLEEALRKAIQNNELVLHYQPKLNIRSSTITGVEALLRWQHPDFSNVNPSVFIPIAEETNLIIPLGEWALREACRINKYWQTEGYEHTSIALNLSPKQFYHPDITDMIAKALNESGLNPSYLELEINESTVMNNVEKATEILNKIKALGVHLVIDHFGMGYTSISHLKQFPVSSLKIDSSFIKGIPTNANDLAITNAFIALGHHFGLEVVAEGVETAEQVEYLSTQNCDMVQGYYFCHPLPADSITQQFKKITDRALL